MDFMAYLNVKGRWPTKGDTLFSSPDDGAPFATVADGMVMRLSFMAAGYKRAADVLVEQALADPRLGSELIYPIGFSYRHYLELAIKDALATFGPKVGIKANWKNHELRKLMPRYLDLLKKYGIRDADGSTKIVAKLVEEFAKIDNGSTIFRFPNDQDGRGVVIGFEAVSLANLRDTMEGLRRHFSSTADYMADLADA